MRRLAAIISGFDTEPVELVMSLISLLTGVYLLIEDGAFPLSQYMAWIDGWLWPPMVGLALFVIGLLGIIVVAQDRARNRTIMAGVRFAAWISLAALTQLGYLASPTYIVYACISAWVYVRVSVEKAALDGNGRA